MSDELSDVTRKLVAVFAADVEGYARLMGADEVGTLKGLTQRRAILDRLIGEHRGRIANTAGDSVLAEFGSAVDAVKCAVDAQTALAEANSSHPPDQRISFRIGVHIGDVMVRAGDLFGDGVNIAARLQTVAKPGAVCVSGATYDQVRKVLPMTFEDLGTQVVKNIQEPVKAYQVGAPIQARETADTACAAETENQLHLPEKPSIAVLPFQNMSGDPEQEYFADGIVEDIITALSRFRSLLVIARNTSFTYKGKAVNIVQVGRELGVRYVLEGSVRKSGGGRVRITGQLIDAATGAHLWADKFDGLLADVFDLQDQVTSNVVGAIAPALQFAETERIRRKPTTSLDSYDLFLRGSAAVWEGATKEAVNYFRKAIEIDDRYAEAYGLLAGSYVVMQCYSGVLVSAEQKAEALRCADMAAHLGTDDAWALARAAQALVYFGKQYERGLAMIERAVSLNANLSSVWLVRGWINQISGNNAEARSSFSRVLTFSQLDPARIGACCGMSYSCITLGEYDEGCAWAAKALQKYANALYLIPLIVNATLAGRKNEAKDAVTQFVQMVPSFRVSHANDVIPSRDADFNAKVNRALLEAGVPS